MTHATLAGIYPRKEELVKATWNLDKGLITKEELRRLQQDQTHEVLELQRRLGFEPLSDGLLAWQDQFRPVIEAIDGFAVGGVTRLFETNRFYRQPILEHDPRLDADRLRAAFPDAKTAKDGSWKAILPSPYWLTRATLDHFVKDDAKLGQTLATVLNEAARVLGKAGFSTIQFNEPALFYEAKPDVGFANELFATAVEGVAATTVANFPNGDAAPHQSFLKTVPVNVIGIDFVETLPEKVSTRLAGRPLLAQVVNAQESLLETPAELDELVARIEKRLQPEELWLTHTWDLEFVPHEVAVRKLEVLAGAVKTRKVTA